MRSKAAALTARIAGVGAALFIATSARGAGPATAARRCRTLDAARIEAAASAVRADPDLGGVRKKSTLAFPRSAPSPMRRRRRCLG